MKKQYNILRNSLPRYLNLRLSPHASPRGVHDLVRPVSLVSTTHQPGTGLDRPTQQGTAVLRAVHGQKVVVGLKARCSRIRSGWSPLVLSAGSAVRVSTVVAVLRSLFLCGVCVCDLPLF